VFEGGLRAWVRALILVGLLEKLQSLVGSEFDPYRSKVAKRCCYVRSSFSSGYAKAPSAYEGAVQQDCEKLLSLARQLPTDCFDIQAYMFR
jgi:hypothetical protein